MRTITKNYATANRRFELAVAGLVNAGPVNAGPVNAGLVNSGLNCGLTNPVAS